MQSCRSKVQTASYCFDASSNSGAAATCPHFHCNMPDGCSQQETSGVMVDWWLEEVVRQGREEVQQVRYSAGSNNSKKS